MGRQVCRGFINPWALPLIFWKWRNQGCQRNSQVSSEDGSHSTGTGHWAFIICGQCGHGQFSPYIVTSNPSCSLMWQALFSPFTQEEKEVQASYGTCLKLVKLLLGRSRMLFQADLALELTLPHMSVRTSTWSRISNLQACDLHMNAYKIHIFGLSQTTQKHNALILGSCLRYHCGA